MMPLVDYYCIDCGEFTDGYMVTDELWNAVVLNKRDCLCLECLERRMDRRLIMSDFQRIKINLPIRAGFAMCRRKYAKEIENAAS